MKPSSTKLILIMVFALALVANSAVAEAPKSLADYLCRRQKDEVPTRSVATSSLIFRADGTYHENWSRIISVYPAGTTDPVADYSTPETGHYLYHKTSDSTAELTFIPANGPARNPLVLHFINDQEAEAERAPFSLGIGDQFKFIGPIARSRSLINISTRTLVHPGEPTIVGFIVAQASDFLVRVAGPSLASFQVSNRWNAPQFKLYAGSNEVRAWSYIIRSGETIYPPPPGWDTGEAFRITNAQAFERTGAFPFSPSSKDVAVVVSLEAGPHTIVVQAPADDSGGSALIELYELR